MCSTWRIYTPEDYRDNVKGVKFQIPESISRVPWPTKVKIENDCES